MRNPLSSDCRFGQMGLDPHVLSGIEKAGYDTPTPIQQLAVPPLMEGTDVLGQARTGTGKTAAFALPLLSRIDLDNNRPQVLVLTPTRELAIQVAQAFKTLGVDMKKLNVATIYGGQGYGTQLNQLKRGAHIVVGTPGRLMDHMRKKTLSLADLFCAVLDEADEMLHMGFIDDVEWILEKAPENAQKALFSATMPGPVRNISKKYLTRPKELTITPENHELGAITQRYWIVKGARKVDALSRILEAASSDGVMVFVNTRQATLDVARELEIKGFKVEALNGDIAQNARERTIARLKSGNIDILVATDVAARGLDVDRITHVVNYDMPPKTEPYIHRIGRTGRAGRQGEAILFLRPKERWMLKHIERATRQKIVKMELPTNQAINQQRIVRFKDRLSAVMASGGLESISSVLVEYAEENHLSLETVAAACAKLAHGDTPFPVERTNPAKKFDTHRQGDQIRKAEGKTIKQAKPPEQSAEPDVEKGMERYRIEVGKNHGLRPGDIVGAIANEAGLASKYIGHISINPEFSLVDLPFGMPKSIFKLLRKTWLRSRRMDISKCSV